MKMVRAMAVNRAIRVSFLVLKGKTPKAHISKYIIPVHFVKVKKKAKSAADGRGFCNMKKGRGKMKKIN